MLRTLELYDLAWAEVGHRFSPYCWRVKMALRHKALGAFQFARAMSPIKLLASTDPVGAWRERMLDAFGGYRRKTPGHDV